MGSLIVDPKKEVSRGDAEAQRKNPEKPHTENTEGTTSHREKLVLFSLRLRASA
jgi:hypothetical protein